MVFNSFFAHIGNVELELSSFLRAKKGTLWSSFFTPRPLNPVLCLVHGYAFSRQIVEHLLLDLCTNDKIRYPWAESLQVFRAGGCVYLAGDHRLGEFRLVEPDPHLPYGRFRGDRLRFLWQMYYLISVKPQAEFVKDPFNRSQLEGVRGCYLKVFCIDYVPDPHAVYHPVKDAQDVVPWVRHPFELIDLAQPDEFAEIFRMAVFLSLFPDIEFPYQLIQKHLNQRKKRNNTHIQVSFGQIRLR